MSDPLPGLHPDILPFCLRVLIEPAPAFEAAMAVRHAEPVDRLQALAGACRACREHASTLTPEELGARAADAVSGELSAAVSREVVTACAQLAERHRETLALRELLGLSYAEIAAVIRVEPTAVASLLARARLRLRTTLRGPVPVSDAPCPELDRSLRALARRQDGEEMPAQETRWLLAHLGTCEQCSRAHAAMLEASASYRAWRSTAAA